MANRCPDCNKFVGLELGEPEVNSLEVDETGIHGEVRLVQTCAECSGEMNEASVEIEQELPDEAAAHLEEHPDHTLSIQEDSSEADEDWRSSASAEAYAKAHGKRISPRYQRHYMSATIHATISCDKCEETWEVEINSDEVSAGEFDSLV